jgi:hypothetical protein
LDSVGPILQQSQTNPAADEGKEQQCKNREARERGVLSRETRVLPIARLFEGNNTSADLPEHLEDYKLKSTCRYQTTITLRDSGGRIRLPSFIAM